MVGLRNLEVEMFEMAEALMEEHQVPVVKTIERELEEELSSA